MTVIFSTAMAVTPTVPLSCGNQVVTGAEECDDGDEINGDGCDTLCTLEHYDLLRGLQQ